MPGKMRTGIAAYMRRRPVPDLLRWQSPMRTEPRSGFAEICELAIGPRAPCIDAKTQLRLRTTEPENYTNGSVQDRGIHIVTQQPAIRAEIHFKCPADGRLRRGVSPRHARAGRTQKWYEGLDL